MNERLTEQELDILINSFTELARRRSLSRDEEQKYRMALELKERRREWREGATETLTWFLNELREYEHESGHSIYTDERSSEEFVKIFLENNPVPAPPQEEKG